jgi:RHS repeat-associated protein
VRAAAHGAGRTAPALRAQGRTPDMATTQTTSQGRGTALVVILVALLLTPATARAQEAVEYYAVDALGSVRVVFNASGAVVGRSDYLPFGEAIAPTGNLPSQRFTGQHRDGDEGFDYLSARSLQTRTGRMNRVDPIFAGLFHPQKWNRYSYALHNPISLVDPTGGDPIKPEAKPDFRVTVTADLPRPGSSRSGPAQSHVRLVPFQWRRLHRHCSSVHYRRGPFHPWDRSPVYRNDSNRLVRRSPFRRSRWQCFGSHSRDSGGCGNGSVQSAIIRENRAECPDDHEGVVALRCWRAVLSQAGQG